MTDVPTLKRHAELLDRMAAALGIDLEEAVLRGRVDFDEIADSVLRCVGCSAPGHCARGLSAEAVRDSAPGYCRNRALLDRLSVGT